MAAAISFIELFIQVAWGASSPSGRHPPRKVMQHAVQPRRSLREAPSEKLPQTLPAHPATSQLGQHRHHRVQHSCPQPRRALWRPALHRLRGARGVLEGHLQGEGQAVKALRHLWAGERTGWAAQGRRAGGISLPRVPPYTASQSHTCRPAGCTDSGCNPMLPPKPTPAGWPARCTGSGWPKSTPTLPPKPTSAG